MRKKKDARDRYKREVLKAKRRGVTLSSSLPSTPSPTSVLYSCVECPYSKLLNRITLCLDPVCDDCLNYTKECQSGSHWVQRWKFIRNGVEQSRCGSCYTVRQNLAQRFSQQISTSLDSIEEEISLETLWSRVRDKDVKAPACSTKDWNLIVEFHSQLDQLNREVCDVCNEIGFNMRLQIVES